jgi:hypothetical protein
MLPTTFVQILVILWGDWLQEREERLKKIKLHSIWALGETLAVRGVCYSWSKAASWLEDAHVALQALWGVPGSLYPWKL